MSQVVLLDLLFLLLFSYFNLHLSHHFLHSNCLTFIFSVNLSFNLILEIDVYLPVVFKQFSFEIFDRLPELLKCMILYKTLPFK
jgi:hypothetical protein